MNPFEQQTHPFNPQVEALEAEPFKWSSEGEWGETGWGGETGVFNEQETAELANGLLDVTNEHELDMFLGDLISKAGSALGKVVSSPIGQAVGGLLKGAAKKALPLAGAALGGFVGGPLGAQIGSGLAASAGDALGLEQEMEGGANFATALPAKSAAFDRAVMEATKKFVKAGGKAVKDTLKAAPGTPPAEAARTAVTGALKKHLPELLAGAKAHPGHAGRWVRHGRNIIIVNCAPTRA